MRFVDLLLLRHGTVADSSEKKRYIVSMRWVGDTPSGDAYYAVHGTFVATMVEDQCAPDAGDKTASLTIGF
jgi:hypothetical protein